jgi:hypothetical protein
MATATPFKSVDEHHLLLLTTPEHHQTSVQRSRPTRERYATLQRHSETSGLLPALQPARHASSSCSHHPTHLITSRLSDWVFQHVMLCAACCCCLSSSLPACQCLRSLARLFRLWSADDGAAGVELRARGRQLHRRRRSQVGGTMRVGVVARWSLLWSLAHRPPPAIPQPSVLRAAVPLDAGEHRRQREQERAAGGTTLANLRLQAPP